MVQQEGVIGFDDIFEEKKSNTKKKDFSKKKGGFYSLGLSFDVLKGVQKRGYKTPTPIQRKTIPLILEGRDVVAMARTGSGKTACFLIPLFEKLKHQIMGKSGIRGLILSPTRELALQTLKFVKELGKFTGLKAAVVLGGDAMETQFSAIHNNPDIIVATPGRFLHICVEMELKLNKIEYIVFDEADRLFEMGFGEQLREIVHRLPENRQTLLFSATLPKVLVEFARAGLNDPVLLRLDVENKLPETLDLSFISCRSDEKPAALLCLLKQLITDNSLTLIFAATKHHVEYLHYLLDKVGIENTYLYSDLAPAARKINAAKFQTGKVRVLVVTDVAARGIDIPHLDYVINYNFPAKAKLFVHRVGRCARAERKGTSFSLVSNDELCYLVDLYLFLGRPLSTVSTDGTGPPEAIGRIPQSVLEDELSQLILLHESYSDLRGQFKVSENAYKQYLRSRPGASTESVKRVKQLNLSAIGTHHAFSSFDKPELDKADFLAQMKKYRPQGTIFEIGLGAQSETYNVMKIKRHRHSEKINKHRHLTDDQDVLSNKSKVREEISLESSNAADITNTFSRIITPGKRKLDSGYTPRSKKFIRSIDNDHFIPYKPTDQHTEEGLAVDNFQQSASRVMLDLTGDTENALKKSSKTRMVWDKKKKRMVGVNSESKVGKIKSESGAWIPATYKSGRYKNWVEKNKAGADQDDSNEDSGKRVLKPQPNTHWGRHNIKVQQARNKEMKNADQILKQRMIEEKKRKKNARKSKRTKRKTK